MSPAAACSSPPCLGPDKERITMDLCCFDIPYASGSPAQKLDLYLPEHSFIRPVPLILFAHGGAFTFGDKRDGQEKPILRGLARGFAVASIEYRKCDEACFPAMVYDAKTAVRYLCAHAAEYGLDTQRFYGWGPSSGGWLMSMLGVTAGNPAFEDLSMGCSAYSSALQAVVDWCGPCGDFLRMDADFVSSNAGVADHSQEHSPESRFLGAEITRVPELCRMACPCTYVSRDTPPFLIVHGGRDQIVSLEQSTRFYDALCSAAPNTGHRLYVAEGKLHHGHPWYEEAWVADMGFAFLSEQTPG